MKFTVSTQEFNYLITKCLSIIPQKPAIPILSNFLIEASKGVLSITSTDLTVGIRCETEVEVIEEGATTLQAKHLSSLTRELTVSNLEIATGTDEMTTISAGSSRFRLNGMSYTAFPALPDLLETTSFTVNQLELKNVLSRTVFTVSKEDSRVVIGGIYAQVANGRITFSSTDGKRLSRSYLLVNIDPSYAGSFVIPVKAVEEVLKNLTEKGDVTVHLMKDKIAFQTTYVTLITKLIAGEYPDTSRFIPMALEHLFHLHCEELVILLRQIALFTDDTSCPTRFVFSQGELVLLAHSKTVGEGKVNMPVNYQGEPFEITFNALFFLDFLRHCKSETVTLGVFDRFSPGVIIDQVVTEYNPAEPDPLFVLMPMRINE